MEEFMKAIPFDPATDLAPVPFDSRHLHLAREMKKRGLEWKPHAGCFVWDYENIIKVHSPFPLNIYFVLSLPRFMDIFDNLDNMKAKLVWLPTWHQARLLADNRGVDHGKISALWSGDDCVQPGEELLMLYRLILEKISKPYRS
jgi:hypothetical protein